MKFSNNQLFVDVVAPFLAKLFLAKFACLHHLWMSELPFLVSMCCFNHADGDLRCSLLGSSESLLVL